MTAWWKKLLLAPFGVTMAGAIVIGLVNGPLSRAQAQADTPKPSFEVASVKPNVTGDNNTAVLLQPGGRFVATNYALSWLICYAYRVRPDQLLGGPNWISTDRWNIEAKAEEGAVTNQGPLDPTLPDQYAIRVQSLLEYRFGLKIHRETKNDLQAYNLVAANGGAKLKLAEDQSPPPFTFPSGENVPRGQYVGGRTRFDGSAIPISYLTDFLSKMFQRNVIDKTDLKGLYDIKLEWTPEMGHGPPTGPDAPPSSDGSEPSIFTALQEQLGLKLEPTKAPGEIIVIDSVQRLSEN